MHLVNLLHTTTAILTADRHCLQQTANQTRQQLDSWFSHRRNPSPPGCMQWYHLLLRAAYGLATAHALLCIVNGDDSPAFRFLSLVTLTFELRQDFCTMGGMVVQQVRHLGLQSVGCGFKSCSRQRCVTTLGKLFTPMCLCHQAV